MQKDLRRLFSLLMCAGLLMVLALPAGAKSMVTASVKQELPSVGSLLPFGSESSAAQPSLAISSSDATVIDLVADLPGCQVEEIKAGGQLYSRLYGEGYGFPQAVGLPELPVLRRDIEIPFGADVSLEVVEAQYADYSLAELGLYPIYPLQASIPKIPGATENMPFEIDEAFYAGGPRYPSVPAVLGEVYVVRGHRVQTVEIWPVAYDPSVATVRLYRQLVFRLRLSGSDTAQTQEMAERYASPLFEPRLSRQLLNYNQGRPAVQFSPNTDVGYLIIAADVYYDAMVPFVTLKESRGYDVTMTRLSQIPGGSSNTAIKAYVQDAYDNWPLPPSYVLLVGDTNTVPGWNSVAAGEVTDLYYATMDGSSDWHPDLGRGRFPVRSAAQTTIMVDKYLDYAELTGQELWLKWASFIATCDQWQVAEGTHNYVIDSYTEPEGYTGTFPSNPQPGGDRLYCITHSADRSDVHNALNQGRWVAIYSGHGSHTGWEFYGASDVQSLSNSGMLPFVASHACITGDFEVTEVYGETWVLQEDAGALVFWGSSDSSYWGEDDVLERAMFDSLFSETKSYADVTEMTYDGLAATEAAYPGLARYYWETYNILGDPSVRVFRAPDLPTFTLTVEPDDLQVCAGSSASASVEVGSILSYSQMVYLEMGHLPAGVTAVFDPAFAAPPFAADLTLAATAEAAAGSHGLAITATDQVSWTLAAQADLEVVSSAPEMPAPVSPADGSGDQALTPLLEWGAEPSAASYDLQMALDALFADPVIDEQGIVGNSFASNEILEGGRCYWWRVRSNNACGVSGWSDPAHFCTVALAATFVDDMESGDGNWSHQADMGTDNWTVSDDSSHSPDHAWHVPDDAVVTDSYLWTPDAIPVVEGSTLTFWHRYQFEGTNWDGGVLEISSGIGRWTDLGSHIVANGYNNTLSSSYGNPLGGRQAWTGDLLNWTQVEVDLSAFAGQAVRIRWRIGSDSSTGDVGWFIDDVQITSALPPRPAPSVFGITPSEGSIYEDTEVQIEGSGFWGPPNVKLGDTWLMSVTVVDSATLSAIVPMGMESGLYGLTLYNGDCQQASMPEAFTATTEPVFRHVYLPLVIRSGEP